MELLRTIDVYEDSRVSKAIQDHTTNAELVAAKKELSIAVEEKLKFKLAMKRTLEWVRDGDFPIKLRGCKTVKMLRQIMADGA